MNESRWWSLAGVKWLWSSMLASFKLFIRMLAYVSLVKFWLNNFALFVALDEELWVLVAESSDSLGILERLVLSNLEDSIYKVQLSPYSKRIDGLSMNAKLLHAFELFSSKLICLWCLLNLLKSFDLGLWRRKLLICCCCCCCWWRFCCANLKR